MGTSRNTRKDDIVLMGGCGYFGGNYKEQHPGAALPAPPPHHCPAPASAEVCGDDGNMEVEEMETSQQQHLILVIRYKCILSTHSKSGPVPVLVGRCA